MNFWDEKYAGSDYYYGCDPNVFIAECILNNPVKGKILFPAEGEGRNAVFAASQGWEADAFDSSTEARKKAENLAGTNNVSINYFIEDLFGFVPDPEKYDAIALSFVHMPSPMRKNVHQNLIKGLKKGGMIFLEAYTKEQMIYQTGGPADEAMLFDPDDLRSDFNGLKIHLLKKQLTYLAEGRHHGISSVVRLIAEK